METLEKKGVLSKKEVRKGKLARRMVCVKNGDLLQEKVECIINSIGEDVPNGFGGAIANCILKVTGDKIIEEAIEEAKKAYGTTTLKPGQFVCTSAQQSSEHKVIVHCVCPAWDTDNCEEILRKEIQKVLEVCNKYQIESISIPPMSSGILGFPIDRCAYAFFHGIFGFLDKVKLFTTIKKMNVIIYEPDKKEKFQEAWMALHKEKYGELDDDEGGCGIEDLSKFDGIFVFTGRYR